MIHTYNITGMTCGSCVAKVKSELLKMGDITEANIQLAGPQATIQMQKHIPVPQLQAALAKAGPYTISEVQGMGATHTEEIDETGSWFNTYKPILLIGLFITGITMLVEARNGDFALHSWMPNFMAGFFLVFSFFKFLSLTAFVDSYAMYDVIAKKWRGWGYVYPFVELLLGIAFLVHFNPLLTNGVTFVVMSVSLIGVLQSVLGGRKIACACLGAVFNLPMSTVTIVEDALMIAMSGFMLLQLL